MTDRVKATAAPTTVKIGTEEFKMSPLTNEDMAIMDQWVRSRHVRIARETLSANATEEQKDRTERIALEQASMMTFTSGSGVALMGHLDALSQLFWCSIRRYHPDMTPEKVQELITDPDNLEAFQDEWDRMNIKGERHVRVKDEKKKKRARKAKKKSRIKNR